MKKNLNKIIEAVIDYNELDENIDFFSSRKVVRRIKDLIYLELDDFHFKVALALRNNTEQK
jgi:hypothetical protein